MRGLMLRILSIIISLFPFHNHAAAENAPVKKPPPLPPHAKEVPPIENASAGPDNAPSPPR